MKQKRPSKSPIQSNVVAFRCGVPLVIKHGQVDDSLIQVAHYISGLFKRFEHEDKVPVQANIEISVIVHED